MKVASVVTPLRAHDNHTRRVVKLAATPEQTFEVVAHRGKRVVVIARVRAGGRLWIATDDRESPLYHRDRIARRTLALLFKLTDQGLGR